MHIFVTKSHTRRGEKLETEGELLDISYCDKLGDLHFLSSPNTDVKLKIFQLSNFFSRHFLGAENFKQSNQLFCGG